MTASAPIDDLIAALAQSLGDGSFVKLSLGHYQGAEDALKNIHIRRIIVKREEKLSFTYHYKTRDIVKNYDFAEAQARIRQALTQDFRTATLMTTGFDLSLENRGGKILLRKAKPSQTAPASTDHDRSKKRLIAADGKDYLRALKITGDDGHVLKNAQEKYRQINRYVEILSPLIKELPARDPLTVADMGAGKGYLTFALYDYLRHTLQLNVRVTGVEFRADLVALCNRIAAEAGFDGLTFVEGSIDAYAAAGTNILIALHACDTATDDAIYKGIAAQADLIVVAPCCHKQIRRQIEQHKARNDLDFLTRHGIFLERQTEMVTDAIRALLLEYAGYSVKVFEFISDAHTPKNVMIVATRNPDAAENPGALAKVRAAKAYFGIGYHHLERLMGLETQ